MKKYIIGTSYYIIFAKKRTQLELTKSYFLVYGEKVLSKRQCQNWFKRFNGGDFPVIDKQRSGRPIEVCDNVINDIINDISLNSSIVSFCSFHFLATFLICSKIICNYMFVGVRENVEEGEKSEN